MLEPPMPPAATPLAPMLTRRTVAAVERPSTNSCAALWFFTNTFSCQPLEPAGAAGTVKCVVQRQAVPAGRPDASTVGSTRSAAQAPAQAAGSAPDAGWV